MRSIIIGLVIMMAPLFLTQEVITQTVQQSEEKPNPAFATIVDDPKLPRVLLIGDSISIGYTLPVRELLKGKANVHRVPINAGPTFEGLKNIDSWMGSTKWDVIHFNFGMGDLKDMRTDKEIAEGKPGRRQVMPDRYEANLREFVAKAKKSGAKLIWCSTTPVPEGAEGRVPDEVKYNAIAARVMTEEGVAIDDLYSFALPRLEQIQIPRNVHFTPEGSRVLAGKVADSILASLAN